MFAIFSLIQNQPQIYQIHIHEETCKKNIEELVKQYIIQNRTFENQDPLQTNQNETLNPESFKIYPAYTYQKIDDQSYDIFYHELVDKVEKGWVWNGVSKTISSKKIGYFQIQSVLEKNIVEPEVDDLGEEITEEQLKMYQDIENMIDEMLRSIESGNEQLEKDKEEIKRLPYFEEEKNVPNPLQPFTFSSEPIPIPIRKSNSSTSVKTIYNVKDDPLQENIKSNLIQIESKFLNFFDEDDQQDRDQQDRDQQDGDQLEQQDEHLEPTQEEIDLCDSFSAFSLSESITNSFPTCHWSQRGKGGKRTSSRRKAYVPSQGYRFRRIHLV